MTPTVSCSKSAPKKTDLRVVGVAEGEELGGRSDLPATLSAAFLDGAGFRAGLGETLHLPPLDDGGPAVLLVGVGAADALDAAAFRKAGASLARSSKDHRVVSTDLTESVPDSLAQVDAAQAFAEGMVMGAYRYDELRSDPDTPNLERIVVVTESSAVRTGVSLGVTIASAVNFARDLVNEPGGTLTPQRLAEEAQAMAKREDLKCKIHDEKAIAKLGLGGLLGVNRGSDNPPRLIELSYSPAKPRYSVALVGKGITFDSGGLSIKTGQGMMSMKTDMAGGAAVLGAMSAIAAVKPRVKVTAYVPATDNMLGGDATRPGDVLKFRNGKTAEVLNTDAEGRLVLADALSLASEQQPDAIIDLATLTGASMVALGDKVAAVMTNNQAWADQVLEAGTRTGERLWQLPLPSDYRSQLDSSIADMKNIGGSYGGAITAGLFLQEFVADDIPWVHIDLAGPSNADKPDGHIRKGGTGFGVRALLEVLSAFQKI